MSKNNSGKLAAKFYNDFMASTDLALFCEKYFTNKTIWEIFLPENISYGGSYHGCAEILAYFKAIFQNMKLTNFEVKNIVSEGDTAVVFVSESSEIIPTSRSLEMDSVHLIKFKNNKVSYVREYCDTHAMAIAFSDNHS